MDLFGCFEWKAIIQSIQIYPSNLFDLKFALLKYFYIVPMKLKIEMKIKKKPFDLIIQYKVS